MFDDPIQACRSSRPVSRTAPSTARGPRTCRALGALAGATFLLAAVAGPVRADERCGIDLQNDVCLEATGSCPAYGSPGLDASPWPVFQQNLQHTGHSPFAGPTCDNEIWTSKIKGKILSTPAIGADGTIYFASAKYPVCALDPANGNVLWCGTDNLGKLPDYSSPTVGNGGFIYVGTRDNDMWAIDIPPLPASQGTVAWRQKVAPTATSPPRPSSRRTASSTWARTRSAAARSWRCARARRAGSSGASIRSAAASRTSRRR